MSNKRYINAEKAISILRLRSQQLAGMYGDIGGAASGAALILERLADEEAEDVVPVVRGENIGFLAESDQFICSNCGIELRGWYEVTVETNMIGDSELVGCDYAFKYCPNCGAELEGQHE